MKLNVRRRAHSSVFVVGLSVMFSSFGTGSVCGQVSWAGSANSDTIAVAGPVVTMHSMPSDSAPVALTSHALEHEGYRWMRNATDHIDLYYMLDSYSFELSRKHRYQAEDARVRALEILGESGYEDRVSVFYLDSPEDMHVLFGESQTGKVDLLGNAAAFVLDEQVTSRQRHEIMHVLSWGSWGMPAAPYGWISEGLAVFAQGSCGGDEIRRTTQALRRNDALIPTDSLVYHFEEFEDAVAYIQAGSLVEYIHDEHGAEVLRGIWQHGVDRTLEIAGLTLEQIDVGWMRYLTHTENEQVVALQQVGRGC